MINGKIPCETVVNTDTVMGFKDINPQAPHHVLFIPKTHIPTINDLTQENISQVGELYLEAQQYIKSIGEDGVGYRLVMNCNAAGGQSVYHIHLHALAGRDLTWPPG